MKGDFVNLGKQPIWGDTQHMQGASISSLIQHKFSNRQALASPF